jgi:hypothetical protein
VTYLSRMTKLGIAAETEPSAYQAPQFTIPFLSARFSDAITQLTDRTVRGTDTDLQGIGQGCYWSDWTITTAAYPDWAGWLYRAIIGPDTLTAGIATTFAQAASPGAAQVWLDAAPAAGAPLMLGSGDTLEYAQAGTPSGSGPFLVPIAQPSYGLRSAHPAGDAAQSAAVHAFAQDRPPGSGWPSYSLTTDDGAEVLGWPYTILGKVRLQVNAEGYVKLTSTWNGWPPSPAAAFAESETIAQPLSGWAWGVTDAGGTSTRGVTLDLTLSRALDIVPALCGQQAPLGIFAGPLRATGAYTAVFDTTADLDLYRQAIKAPAVMTITQPVLQGGASVAVTQSLSGWTAGEVVLGGSYVTASFRLAGVTNMADSPYGGVASAEVVNYRNSAYGP